MMNPSNTHPRTPTEDSSSMPPSKEGQARETGLKGWIHRHFGAEPPQRHSENFFISDVTEGGIGSHHHHQVYRPDRRH